MSMTDGDIAKARGLIARSGAPTWVMPSWHQALEGWSAALDEVERLTKLHALAEQAMRSANEASNGFEEQAQRYFEEKEPLEVVADAARSFVDRQKQLSGGDFAADLFSDLEHALNQVKATT